MYLRVIHSRNAWNRIDPKMSFASRSTSQYILQEAFNISDPNSLGTSDAINNPRIRSLLETVAKESKTLQLLDKDRKAFKAKFNITEEEIGMLQSADLLSAVGWSKE